MLRFIKLEQPDNSTPHALYLNLPPALQTFICTGYTDLRKSIDGLIEIVQQYGLNHRGMVIYGFCGKRADRIKLLYYNAQGYSLILERMEDIRYRWPRQDGEMWKLSRATFLRMLDGEKIDESNTLRVFKRLHDPWT